MSKTNHRGIFIVNTLEEQSNMSLENGTTSNGGTLPKNCFSRLQACDEYILNSSINELQQPKLAISIASSEVLLFDVESQIKVGSNKTHQNKITGLKFSKQDPNLFFSSSLDGRIMLYDLREGKGKPAQSYSDDSDGSLKPITCFDYNSQEQYICGGTEVIREDSFLIFWDRRMPKAIGGYWESHFDEITQVQFHRSLESNLASASVDGLLNFFDLIENTEEDAMNNTLNVESSINRFCWAADTVSCITSTEEFQYWSTNEVKPTISMTKKQMSEDFMCDVDYLIDTFDVNENIYLASGTNEGSIQLYSCINGGLRILCELRDGHKDIVRTVCHSKKDNFLVTGGEDGILCVWKSPIQ